MRIAQSSPQKVQLTGDKAPWAPCGHICSHHWSTLWTEDSIQPLLYCCAYMQPHTWSRVTTLSDIHTWKQEIVFRTALFMSPSVPLPGLSYLPSGIPYRAHQHCTQCLQAQYFTMYVHLTLVYMLNTYIIYIYIIYNSSIWCNSSASALWAGDSTDWKWSWTSRTHMPKLWWCARSQFLQHWLRQHFIES